MVVEGAFFRGVAPVARDVVRDQIVLEVLAGADLLPEFMHLVLEVEIHVRDVEHQRIKLEPDSVDLLRVNELESENRSRELAKHIRQNGANASNAWRAGGSI